jgi:DNA-binding NarL/FixJ family response regulator
VYDRRLSVVVIDMIATSFASRVAVDGVPETSKRPVASLGVVFSPRERQVVKFILNGCSNQEIADCLGLRLQTVKNHLSRIYRKFDVPNRVQLAVCVLNSGMVQMEP